MRIWLKIVFQTILAASVFGAHAGAYEDFFRAVAADDAATVKALMARGVDPNSAAEDGQTPLILALRSQSTAVAEALLAHADLRVDATNAAGETALMIASIQGDRAWVARLLDRGAQVNRSGWTPLHYAASGPSLPVLDLLLERGAALEARSPNGTTPLMMASRYGSEEAALALLRRGADTRTQNDRGLAAADFARMAGRDALASKLTAPVR